MASETNGSGQNRTTPLEATSATPSSLADFLTGYLTRRGWVEDDLAAHLGVELSTLRRLLLEPAPTSSDRVAALAAAYGASTSRLLSILWLEQVLPRPAIDDERPRQGVELVSTEAANAEEHAHTTSRLIIRGTERYFELTPAQRERVRRALARIAGGIDATPYLIAEVEVAHDAGPKVGSVAGQPTSRPDSGRAVGEAGATDAAPGSGAAESASHTELIQVLMGTAGFPVGITPTPLARMSSPSDSVAAVFRELFDEAPIAYHELDLDGRIIRVNRTELAWLGYTQAEMVGHYVWEFSREAEESRRGFFAKAAERESGNAYERTYRRKDGSWVCGLVEDRLIRDINGHVIGSRSAILDITDRKRSEDGLRLSEQRLRLAVDGAPVSLFTQDIDLRYTWVYNVAGMAAGDLLGKADAELWPADEAGPLIALKREVLERGHDVRRVVRLTVENAPRQLEIRAEPLRSTGGQVVGLVGAAVDVTGHRQTETAWRASAERYRRLLEAAPDATVLVAASGRILLLNRQSEHLFGYDQDELVGQPVELLLPEQLRGVHFEHRTQFAASPKRRPMGAGLELSARRKDGSEVPVEISLSPLELDDERVVIASIRDCTERRRTEAALRQQAAELRSQAELLELVHDAVIVREPTTSAIVFWNRAAERLYGWTRAEAQRQITHSLLRTEFPVSLEAVDAVLARDGVWEGELKHVTKDGRWLLVASRQALQRDEHGQPTAILEINRDVTEQRHAEQALVTSEQRYRIVSELTSDFAYAARLQPDGSRIPEWITEAVTEVTGYSPAEIVERRTILSLAHPDDQARVAALNTRVIAGVSATEELRLVTKAGQLRWVRLYNQPEVDEVTGRVVRVYGAVQDITAVRELEQQKDALLSVVSHDLRNPLSAIKTCVELALDHEPTNTPPPFHQLLLTIAGATDRLERISNDLVDLARLQLGQALPLKRRPIDLVAVVHHLIAGHRQLTDRHTIRFEPVVPALVGHWDGPRLERVVENLLNNAIKYSPAGGEVTISLHRRQVRKASWAVLSVRDQGLGIPAKELPHVFTRFFRASNVTGKIAGIGLGLAGAKQIVEQHGGTLVVESHVGVGSRFTLRLPC